MREGEMPKSVHSLLSGNMADLVVTDQRSSNHKTVYLTSPEAKRSCSGPSPDFNWIRACRIGQQLAKMVVGGGW